MKYNWYGVPLLAGREVRVERREKREIGEREKERDCERKRGDLER